jgi:hypothetical protein
VVLWSARRRDWAQARVIVATIAVTATMLLAATLELIEPAGVEDTPARPGCARPRWKPHRAHRLTPRDHSTEFERSTTTYRQAATATTPSPPIVDEQHCDRQP